MTASTTDAPANLAAAWAALAIPADKLPTIQQIMAAVKQEVGPVGKNSRNAQQNFDYRGIDAVVNALAPALDKYGVLTIPELLESDHSTVEVGQKRSLMGYTRVKVRYHFQGPRGDEVVAVVPGEAMDSGDKAVAKAMSVAYRIALLQAMNLPTCDPDPDGATYERSARDESWRDQPPVNRSQSNGNHANGQRANGTGDGHPQPPPAPNPPPPLSEDDAWKHRIDDVASRDEANMLFTEIVGLHNAGTIDNGRRTLLEAHLRWHMAHPPTRSSEQAADPEPPAQPEQPAASNPPETGEQNPWATQPDFDPLDGSAPEPDTGESSDWETAIRKILREAQHPDALAGIQQQIGAKIASKEITPKTGGELSKELRGARNRIAGAAK